MDTTIIDLVSFDQGFAWRHWAVWYFLLVGSAAGAALIGFLASRREASSAAVGPALFAAAALGIAAPVPLLADLHQPARFLHFYLAASPDSVMWWGSWFLPAFVGGLALLVLLHSPWAGRLAAYRRAAWYWTALFALAVLAYTAGEMTIVQARPLWHAPFFPLLLTLSALVSGAGAVAVSAALRGGEAGIAPRVIVGGSALFVAGIAAWALLGDGDFAQLLLHDRPLPLLVGMTGLCGVGAALIGLIRAAGAAGGLAAGALAMLGALIFRWELFMGAQARLKTEEALMPYSLLTDGDALAGLIGTVGLLAVVVVLLSLILTRGEKGEHGTLSNSAL